MEKPQRSRAWVDQAHPRLVAGAEFHDSENDKTALPAATQGARQGVRPLYVREKKLWPSSTAKRRRSCNTALLLY